METNCSFYVIGTGNDYIQAMWEDALLLKNVHYIETPMLKNFKGRRIYDFFESKIYSFRINSRIRIPLKFFWRKYYSLSTIKFDRQRTNIVIFSDIMRLLSDKKYWRKKKKEYNLTYCVLLLNSCKHDLSIKESVVKRILDFLPVDFIYTFDKKDAEIFGMDYFPSMLSKIECPNKEPIYYDFYFVGKKKNRFDVIVDLYKYLTLKGYNCLFRVTGVNEEEKKKCSGIIYNEVISYQKVVEELNLSKCIVDVKIPEQSGLSLRFFEAIIYNKLLLTNNNSVKDEKFYNEDYIVEFEDVDKVTIKNSFLLQKPEYHYNDEYSPITFLEHIKKRVICK